MKKLPYALRWILCWMLLAAGLPSHAGGDERARLAQGEGAPTGPPAVSPISPSAPPELVKPALPSDFERSAAVFKRLDVARRGYLTLDDTKDLIGFEDAFRAVDSEKTGKLTPAQFSKAWAIYRARK